MEVSNQTIVTVVVVLLVLYLLLSRNNEHMIKIRLNKDNQPNVYVDKQRKVIAPRTNHEEENTDARETTTILEATELDKDGDDLPFAIYTHDDEDIFDDEDKDVVDASDKGLVAMTVDGAQLNRNNFAEELVQGREHFQPTKSIKKTNLECPAFMLNQEDNIEGCPNAMLTSMDSSFGGFSLSNECNIKDNKYGICNIGNNPDSLFETTLKE